MKRSVLCMADIAPYPGVLDPLKDVAEVRTFPPERETLLREIRTADAYLATLCVRADAQVLNAAERLQVIATPSTGLDHIDLTIAAEKGVEVLSLKYDREFLDSITATAELAWALLLACVRKLPAACDAAKRGEWARDKFRGHQLSGKTFGILGYGRLGTMVGQYARAFRMNVLACDIKDFQAEGVRRVDRDTLFRESDVVSIHVHLTPETTGLVGRRELSLMKPGSILINTSRGAIVDEAALLEALQSGHLGAAGLDVIHGEWSDISRHPLIRHARTCDNLIITPHVGGVTHESQAMALRCIAQKLRDFFAARGKAS